MDAKLDKLKASGRVLIKCRPLTSSPSWKNVTYVIIWQEQLDAYRETHEVQVIRKASEVLDTLCHATLARV